VRPPSSRRAPSTSSATLPLRSAEPNWKPSERVSRGSRVTVSMRSIVFTRDWT
jgi:hypothetical protein